MKVAKNNVGAIRELPLQMFLKNQTARNYCFLILASSTITLYR